MKDDRSNDRSDRSNDGNDNDDEDIDFSNGRTLPLHPVRRLLAVQDPFTDRPGGAVWDRFAVWHPISHLRTLAPI